MSYRGVTFNKQTCKSEDDALIFHTFLNGCSGKIKGCAVTYDAHNVYMSTGYFMAYGRLVNIFGAETLTPVAIPTGTQYNRLVFTIDLSKENTAAEFKQGFFQFLSSYDAYPTLTRQDLFNGGTVYQIPIAKFTLTVSGIGNFVEEMGSVSISDVWNTLTQDLAEYRGQFEDFFDTEKTTILQMIADLQAQDFVTNAVFNSQINTINGQITTANTNIAAATAKAQAALLDITDQYSASKTYAIGDYCIYNNVMYKCKTAITVVETWNAAHWTQTTITKEMQPVKITDYIITSGVVMTTILVYKIGKMVHVEFKVFYGTGITNGTGVVLTLPVGCRPAAATGWNGTGSALRAPSATYDDSFGIIAQVEPDGTVGVANDFGITMFGPNASFDFFVN